MPKFVKNVIQILRDLLGGNGGGSSKDHFVSQGGAQDRAKKDHIIFESSLT